MLKSCSKCGRIHDTEYNCTSREYNYTKDRQLRSTYKWRMKSKEIRERAGWLCEVCKDKHSLNSNTIKSKLEVHHIEKVEERPDLLLDNNNLIFLCTQHNKMADNGLLDKEYLHSLAKAR